MRVKKNNEYCDEQQQNERDNLPRKMIEKWGGSVTRYGYTQVPTLLLKGQRRLGLKSSHLSVIIHLMAYWWEVGRKPYPSKQALHEQIGLSSRQIQRILSELDELGLVKRIMRSSSAKARLANEYDFSGLVEKLKELEVEFRTVEKQAREKRNSVMRPKSRRSSGG